MDALEETTTSRTCTRTSTSPSACSKPPRAAKRFSSSESETRVPRGPRCCAPRHSPTWPRCGSARASRFRRSVYAPFNADRVDATVCHEVPTRRCSRTRARDRMPEGVGDLAAHDAPTAGHACRHGWAAAGHGARRRQCPERLAAVPDRRGSPLTRNVPAAPASSESGCGSSNRSTAKTAGRRRTPSRPHGPLHARRVRA